MTRIIVTVGYQRYLMESSNDANDVVSAMSRAVPVEYVAKAGGGFLAKDEAPIVALEFTREDHIEWPAPQHPEKQAVDVPAPVVEVPF